MPESITEERYQEALECLPPSRWHGVAGVSVFHICERITGNLVQWYGLSKGRACTWTDYANINDSQIAAKLAVFYGKAGA